ncbi:hypothetical protein [Phenylobacterium sp.]|uniref:hypothetical protein n=1 Tax=Phenylobacterium sp. TaxID=1871053 RepID=UPI00289635B2|nr:hypothetical protein [Phenylobacterium sp.]
MKWLSFLATVAVLLAMVDGVHAQASRAEPKPGDIYELTLTREMAEQDNQGGTASSHDKDTLIESVVEVRADGLELQYDLPKDATAQERASDWHLPARVFKRVDGATRLSNPAELEARIDGWLKSGGMTRAHCGQLIFTWNAFRIDCDPQSVIGMIERFDLTSFEAREGALYKSPDAGGAARLTRGASGSTLVAETPVDPDAVRRAQAETDIAVAQLMKKPLTLEEALRERAKDTVSGTVAVTFEISSAGDVWRRATVTKLEIGRPNGRLESRTTSETLERRLVAAR